MSDEIELTESEIAYIRAIGERTRIMTGGNRAKLEEDKEALDQFMMEIKRMHKIHGLTLGPGIVDDIFKPEDKV